MLINYLKLRRWKTVLYTLGTFIVILVIIHLFQRKKPWKTNQEKFNEKSNVKLNTSNHDIHIFYYAWYGNKETDKRWIHWNHPRLPHWNKALRSSYRTDPHLAPHDIGANFYPVLGLYSSRDYMTIVKHMEMIRGTGVGTLVISWYPENMSDPNGIAVNDIIPMYLDIAEKHKLKIALHIEPYQGRSVQRIKQDIFYIIHAYSKHPAYYKRKRYGKDKNLVNKDLPVIFVYDSYLITINNWNKLLTDTGSLSIRNKPEDCFVVGLMLESNECDKMTIAGFDGAYTYFGGEKVSAASVRSNWPSIQTKCLKNNILFFPSISPGYVDVSVRPWNSQSTQTRNDGDFYQKSFNGVIDAAIASSSKHGFGITSFNEWHEGTQIEPASPYSKNGSNTLGRVYEDYGINGSNFYLKLTKQFVQTYLDNV